MVLSVDGARVELTSTGHPPAAAVASPRTVVPGPPVAASPGAGPPSAAPAVAGAPAAASPPSAAPEAAHGLHAVTAPSVGIFYRAPEPGAPPFVEEGQHVDAEDIVCIVEVMKLMNHVKAGASGSVRSVEVENGAMVEHGQTLFTIGPQA
jgi:acetyl-CoA carboxylase biotin carboxyl carrier protein